MVNLVLQQTLVVKVVQVNHILLQMVQQQFSTLVEVVEVTTVLVHLKQVVEEKVDKVEELMVFQYQQLHLSVVLIQELPIEVAVEEVVQGLVLLIMVELVEKE